MVRSPRITAPEYPASPWTLAVPLAAADDPGYRFQMLTPLVVLGLGTTGSRIGARFTDELRRQSGRSPESVAAILLDGAQPKRGMQGCHHIPLGMNGCGSDPHTGRQAFLEVYEQILHSVEQATLDLDHMDSHVPAKTSTRHATTFYVIGGNGGSSGGMQEPAISLCHHVGRRLNIRHVRVNQVNLGADMPMRDVGRNVSTEQKLTVPQTAADNFARWLADHQSPDRVLIHPPLDAPFSIRRCDRVWRMFLVDQGNGVHQFARTDEFVEMVALHLVGSLLTVFQESIEDRFADHDKQGGNLRGEEVRHGSRP